MSLRSVVFRSSVCLQHFPCSFIGFNHGARSMSNKSTFNAKDVEIEFCSPTQLKPKPAVKDLVFGKSFTEHMLEIQWEETSGWGRPKISPFHNLSLHPAAKSLHYATELFEGMKAYRCTDGSIRLFRPDQNMARMNRSAVTASLPTFDSEELIALIKKLEQLKVEQPLKALLFVILSPTGPYFDGGFKPISLMADPQYVRAWPGGCGHSKMGANYGPTLAIQKIAMDRGLQQVLWLFGPEHKLTEVGAMNIVVVLDKGNGEKELVTPPVDGLILPGITRLSMLELARSWNEFEVSERDITMKEIIQAEGEGRLLEIFGVGTAVVVCPVAEIHYGDKIIKVPTMDHKEPVNQRIYKSIIDIQYGRVEHPWSVSLD